MPPVQLAVDAGRLRLFAMAIGETNPVHAVVVLLPGRDAAEAQIREHGKALIAGYESPGTVTFVEELPISGAGKILKRELRKMEWAE